MSLSTAPRCAFYNFPAALTPLPRLQELRLDLHMTISAVKDKLYTHNGSNKDTMELQLRDRDGNTLCRMLDESKPLGYYGAMNGMEIHVLDHDPFSLSRGGGLDDVSQIEKYRMTDEEYDAREKTYRAFKKKMMAQDPNWRPVHVQKAQEAATQAYLDPACVAGVEIGKRCSIAPGDRRGEICFVGQVEGLGDGYWVGIKLDEPMGKNNGSYKGKQYFEADDKFGSFVRPDRVTVGDFRPAWEEELEGDGPAPASEGHAGDDAEL